MTKYNSPDLGTNVIILISLPFGYLMKLFCGGEGVFQ